MRKPRIRYGLVWAAALSTLLTADPTLGSVDWGSSARATGMGNAFVAVAGDPSTLFYNPAGLADIRTWMFYAHYARKSKYGLGETENPFLASGVLVAPLRDDLCLGLSGLKRSSWADRTGLVSNNVEGLSIAARLNSRLAVGLSAKSIHNSNYGNQKGADFDLGTLFQLTPGLRLGLAVENLLAADIGADAGVSSIVERGPTRAGKTGLLWHVDQLHGDIAFDLVLDDMHGGTEANYLRSHLGIETQVLQTERLNLALRAGYSAGKEYGRNVRQPALGWGIRYRGARSVCQIDYSWQHYPYQPNETSVGDHRVSVTIYPRMPQSGEKLPPQKEATRAALTQRWDRDALVPKSQRKPMMSVRTEQLLGGQEQFVIFLVQPGAVAHVAEWKLHIYADNAGGNKAELGPLTTLHGWAMPANSVLWDLKLEGEKIPSGTYYYRLEVSDTRSNSWTSDLGSFRIR